MMDQLHQKLIESSSFYRTWHEDKDYHIKHWAIFIAVAIVTLILLIGAINNYVSLELSQSRAATGATYWVSPTGAAAWADCNSSTALNGTSACSLTTANAKATAGDMVYLKGGAYTLGQYQYGIAPANSGTDASTRITYAAAPGETPIITGAGCYECGWGLVLSNNKYIKVTGITFSNLWRWAQITNYSSYNEIANNIFKNDTGEEGKIGFFMYDACNGSTIGCYVTHNWVHHNMFSKVHQGGSTPCVEGADLMRIGIPYTSSFPNPGTGANNYNTIENNYMEYAGHALFDDYGMYTVFRNNILHNEPWVPDYSNGTCKWPPTYSTPSYDNKYGHRSMQSTDDYVREGVYRLLEGNRIGHASVNPNNDGADNLDLAAPKNIVRYNLLYNAMQNGLMFKYAAAPAYGPGQGGNGGINNRVYNNTIYYNGQGYPFYHTCTYSVCPDKQAGITTYVNASGVGNIIKNNIVFGNGSYTYYGRDIMSGSGGDITNTGAIAVNNWTTSNGDPKFINPDISDPKSSNLPDLSLQSSSGAIDAGTYLAQASGSGSNSATLVVNDALYFQDGTWGSDLSRPNLHADWIAVGAVNNVVQISSINYSTNTIILKSPMTWVNNAPIWLFKDSSGKQVLYGFAPDIGAYEYASGTITPPPFPEPPPPPSDTTPPSVSITSPLSGSTITAKTILNIQASASDNAGVSKVDFFINGTLKCTDSVSPYTCSWNVPGRVGRTYRFQAQVTDTSGNLGSSTIVTVTAK